jgi:hypothetical protein
VSEHGGHWPAQGGRPAEAELPEAFLVRVLVSLAAAS